jgi:hypothetical protein
MTCRALNGIFTTRSRPVLFYFTSTLSIDMFWAGGTAGEWATTVLVSDGRALDWLAGLGRTAEMDLRGRCTDTSVNRATPAPEVATDE